MANHGAIRGMAIDRCPTRGGLQQVVPQNHGRDMRMGLCSILAWMAALLIAGCSESVHVSLFNNTPDTICLITANKRLVVPPSNQVRFHPGIDETVAVLIEMQGRRLGYRFNGIPIPNQFLGKKRGDADLYFQLQADAKIYLVEPDSEFPVVSFPDQPERFPLAPVRTIELE